MIEAVEEFEIGFQLERADQRSMNIRNINM